MSSLKILKPNQVGVLGYLIEDDAGYISPNDTRNKNFIQEIKKIDKGQPVIAEPLIVYVVLQKYGVRNKNGRIYPENLLKRENERYQDLIRDNRAIGELDHPECHRESAEILTTEGWKLIKDVKADEKVITLNPETNIIEEKIITKKIVKDYKGKMISIKGRNIDLLVTPNHKFWVIDENKGGKFISAMDIHQNKIKGLAKSYIPKIDGKIFLNEESVKTELVDYDDKVYCVDVPNHIFYVRDNNKACWNGNSSIINGDRVSHTITETWWEGSTLMGKMKIIMSPGFINLGVISCKGDLIANYMRNGIKIGVSSRGVGSLESINGENIVQDDFELICWDVVTTPSTPGSWIFTSPQETQPYIESYIRENDDLLDGLDNFLLS